jgi:hypothetical protein
MAPENNKQYLEVSGVNAWFEQAAMLLQRIENVGYKASDDDIIFSGFDVPNWSTDVFIDNVAECPEDYCVKVTGSSVIRKSGDNSNNIFDPPAILYAFSNRWAHRDFKNMMYRTMSVKHRDQVFLTNHFLKCGCEPFCIDETNPWDGVHVRATCYVEELCGLRIFKISYTDDYPENLKASWASTGTTQVLEWFDECAKAMYGCTEATNFDKTNFVGTRWGHRRYYGYPLVFTYNTWMRSPLPMLTNAGDNGSPVENFPLGVCEGDCDNDADCEVRTSIRVATRRKQYNRRLKNVEPHIACSPTVPITPPPTRKDFFVFNEMVTNWYLDVETVAQQEPTTVTIPSHRVLPIFPSSEPGIMAYQPRPSLLACVKAIATEIRTARYVILQLRLDVEM